MMSNAGGAWDNAKKYCEKDGTKGLSKVKNADGSLAPPMKKTWYDACVVGAPPDTLVFSGDLWDLASIVHSKPCQLFSECSKAY